MSLAIGAGLTVITGYTGGGKTALAVQMMLKTPERPRFVMGVPDLKIEHNKCPPVDEWTVLEPDPDDPSKLLPYFTFPENSIVVLDEAQRIYRPRASTSKVPDYVAAFETRRHTGVDFVLLTQDISFLDSHIRKLCTRHLHIHKTALWDYLLEWPKLGNPDLKSSREEAARTKYKPPKSVFGLYRSAKAHTDKVQRKPWQLYAFVPLVLALIVGGLFVKNKVFDANKQTTAEQATLEQPKKITTVPPGQLQDKGKVLNAAEYVEQQKPRIEGLMHTAVIYDELTQPKIVPEPVGCIDSKRTGCKCFTQQGTPYQTTPEICQQILASGLFMHWKEPEDNKPVKATPVPQNQQLAQGPAFHILEQGKSSVTTPATLPMPAGGGPSTNPRFNPELRQQTPL